MENDSIANENRCRELSELKTDLLEQIEEYQEEVNSHKQFL